MICIRHLFYGFLLLLFISDLSSADVRICGKSLTQFLEMVCVDGFNPKNLKAKKSDSSIHDINDSALDNYIHPSAFSSLFMDKIHAESNSLMAKTRRRRFDGVADECCRKPCIISELLSYCI